MRLAYERYSGEKGYTRLYLQDDILAKVDRASMLNGLEVRSPYLALPLVDNQTAMLRDLFHIIRAGPSVR